MKTYVTLDGLARFVNGKFEPTTKYQEFVVIDPIARTSQSVAAMHIKLMPQVEATEFETRIAPVLAAWANELAEKRKADGPLPREARCYRCDALLNAARDQACGHCRWMECPQCGACGCGYNA